MLPVFCAQGDFDGASLDELAAAAGLNRPNLAAAFGDKRGLYLATLERFMNKFVDEAGRILDQPGSLRNCLDQFFDFAATIYTRDELGCFVFGTAPAASGDDSESKPHWRAHWKQLDPYCSENSRMPPGSICQPVRTPKAWRLH